MMLTLLYNITTVPILQKSMVGDGIIL